MRQTKVLASVIFSLLLFLLKGESEILVNTKEENLTMDIASVIIFLATAISVPMYWKLQNSV